jgi:hypothetical protein
MLGSKGTRKIKTKTTDLLYVYKRRKKKKMQLLKEMANHRVLELAPVTSGLMFFLLGDNLVLK